VNLNAVRDHYEQSLSRSGDSGAQVGWRDSFAQLIRFEVIWRVLDGCSPESITDVDCGTGDLLRFLRTRGWIGKYSGIDISPKMISTAKERFHDDELAMFSNSLVIPHSDFAVASGIFNVSLGADSKAWLAYCEQLICQMWEASGRGVVFNMLSSDSDQGLHKSELSYFDLSYVATFVRTNLTQNLRLD
jgi:SAM-dependent methyltransferase